MVVISPTRPVFEFASNFIPVKQAGFSVVGLPSIHELVLVSGSRFHTYRPNHQRQGDDDTVAEALANQSFSAEAVTRSRTVGRSTKASQVPVIPHHPSHGPLRNFSFLDVNGGQFRDYERDDL